MVILTDLTNGQLDSTFQSKYSSSISSIFLIVKQSASWDSKLVSNLFLFFQAAIAQQNAGLNVSDGSEK